MYFLILEAYPMATHRNYGRIDGAFAACFVDASSAEGAERAARAFLADANWEVEGVDETVRWIDRSELLGNAESEEHFDQALVDGIVVSMNTWPVGALDEEGGEPEGDC
jgi:hypothetical protein